MDFAYTLSWNKRYYGQLLDRWFYDKFDNRHKLSINAQYRMGKGIYAYAGWTCHSGNRMTLPTHYTALPSLGEAMAGEALLYTEPNNFRLPAYHRLDIGCTPRARTDMEREPLQCLLPPQLALGDSQL